MLVFLNKDKIIVSGSKSSTFYFNRKFFGDEMLNYPDDLN